MCDPTFSLRKGSKYYAKTNSHHAVGSVENCCFSIRWSNFIIRASKFIFTVPTCANIIDLKRKANYKHQSIIMAGCVCCGEKALGLWLLCWCREESVESQLKLCIERLIKSEWSFETFNTSHFSLSFQVGRIWLVFRKVKSNSSMWFVSELIMMINWLSTQISSERCQAARRQG